MGIVCSGFSAVASPRAALGRLETKAAVIPVQEQRESDDFVWPKRNAAISKLSAVCQLFRFLKSSSDLVLN